jgi:hypothetical protein
LRSRSSREHKNSGADDGADTQGREVEGAKGASQSMCAILSGSFGLKDSHTLFGPDTHSLSPETGGCGKFYLCF